MALGVRVQEKLEVQMQVTGKIYGNYVITHLQVSMSDATGCQGWTKLNV